MNKGFSLVELIVVIAIMAILVGVAVPVYTQYITGAEEKVDAQYADELERAVNTVCIDLKAGLTHKGQVVPKQVVVDGSTVKVYSDAGSTEITGSPFATMLADIIDLSANEYKYTFTIGANDVVTNVAKAAKTAGSNNQTQNPTQPNT
jgi:prepilin-type N-terminal cleavage/methylation domain-containing protein